MAIQTHFMTNALQAAGGVHQNLATAAPAAATSAAGWTVGKLAAGQYAHLDAGTKAATGAFSGVVKPGATINTGAGLGNALMSAAPITGAFEAGNWSFTFEVIATVASTQRGRIRFRVWRGTNASGAGATEITNGTDKLTNTLAANLGAVAVDLTATVSMPQVTLNNEYLFVTVAWEITQAGGSNTADVMLRVGTGATGFTTTNAGNVFTRSTGDSVPAATDAAAWSNLVKTRTAGSLSWDRLISSHGPYRWWKFQEATSPAFESVLGAAADQAALIAPVDTAGPGQRGFIPYRDSTDAIACRPWNGVPGQNGYLVPNQVETWFPLMCGTSGAFPKSFSAEMVVKLQGHNPTGTTTLLNARGDATFSQDYIFQVTIDANRLVKTARTITQELAFPGGPAAGWIQLTSATPLTLDAPHHIFVTYDGPTDTLSLYIDGVLAASGTSGGFQRAMLAGGPATPSAFLASAIPLASMVWLDELVLYDTSLGLPDITQHAAVALGTAPQQDVTTPGDSVATGGLHARTGVVSGRFSNTKEFIKDTGPSAFWALDSAPGATTATDSQGGGANMTGGNASRHIFAATGQPDIDPANSLRVVNGAAAALAATGRLLESHAASAVKHSKPFTVGGLVQITTTPSAAMSLFTYATKELGWNIALQVNASRQVVADIYVPGPNNGTTTATGAPFDRFQLTSAAIADAATHYVALVFTGTVFQLVIDGTVVATSAAIPAGASLPWAAGVTQLGVTVAGTGELRMQHWAVWRRALSPEQIGRFYATATQGVATVFGGGAYVDSAPSSDTLGWSKVSAGPSAAVSDSAPASDTVARSAGIFARTSDDAMGGFDRLAGTENGGFEGGTVGGWAPIIGDLALTNSTAWAYAGTHSLDVVGLVTFTDYIVLDAGAVVPGGSYTATARINDLDGDDISIALEWRDASGTVLSTDYSGVVVGPGISSVSVTGTAPPAAATVRLLLGALGGGGGAQHWRADAITLTALAAGGLSDAPTRTVLAARSAADSAPASDAASRVAVHPRAVADAAPASDAAAVLGTSASTSDSAPSTDSAARAIAAARASFDAAPATDATTRATARPRAPADTASATDATARMTTASRGSSDSAPATDAAIRLATRPRSTADAAPAADVAARTIVAARAASDAAPATDAAARSAARPRAPGDAASATDTAARTTTGSRASGDTATAADSPARAATRPRAATDTAGAADASTRALAAARAASDAAVASDAGAAAVARGRLGADTASAADSTARSVAASRAGSDAAAATDATTRTATRPRSASDSAPATDAPARVTVTARGGTDNAPASDSTARTSARPRASTDTAPATDSAGRQTTAARTGAELAAATDATTRTATRPRAPADTATAIDASTRQAAVTRAPADASTTTDATATAAAGQATTSDSAPATDSAQRAISAARARSDSAPATDAAVRAAAHPRAAGDTATSTDTATRHATVTRTPADATTVTDTTSTATSGQVSTNDAAPAADSAQRSTAAARASADSGPATDSAKRAIAASRATADSAPTADTAARSTSAARQATDAAGVTDAVSRTTIRARAASDTAPANDATTRTRFAFRSTSDTASATDSAATQGAATTSTSDAASATDALQRTVNATRASGDSAGATDTTARRVTVSRQPADSAAGADTAAARLAAVRAAADTAIAADAAARAAALTRQLADAAGAGDALAVARVYARAVADFAVAIDTAASVRRATAAAGDAAPATDATYHALVVARFLYDVAAAGDALVVKVRKRTRPVIHYTPNDGPRGGGRFGQSSAGRGAILDRASGGGTLGAGPHPTIRREP